MTKHNGKARNSGIKVGAALMARNKKAGPSGAGAASGRHTTDIHKGGPGIQSVLERNDLGELMAMADLAGRDFTAERANVIVVSTGVVNPLSEQRAAEERAVAEARNAHRLRLPRRPAWDESTTPDQLEAQERGAFVEWRRGLATLEEDEGLVLTPFEKNLEVWRQLWRVLERSDVVVQVVDARDPLLYRCSDLEAYAAELHATKTSLLLLNKADLLPDAVRLAWADYFDRVGIRYVFWSAFTVQQEQAALKAEATELGEDWHELRERVAKERRLTRLAERAAYTASLGANTDADGKPAVSPAERIRVLSAEELIDVLEEAAREAVAAAGPDDPRAQDPERRLMVGLVGYPNVGKSSTINALFGSKKTAVAPTPGKTKHFQTLFISNTLCLCDCPGLVMPKFARSKAEMVVAGVIPIDRLTEIRAPVEVLATRVGRAQVEECYGLRLPPAPPHLPPYTPPTAAQLLRALALMRGWTAGSGLPDESRAGRQLLKDYTSGKLLHCTLPPGASPEAYVPLLHDPVTMQLLPAAAAWAGAAQAAATASPAGAAAAAQAASARAQQPAASQLQGSGGAEESLEGEGLSEEGGEEAGVAGPSQLPTDLDDADLDLLMGDLGISGGSGAAGAGEKQAKAKRADHKFHKKAARSKGDRGQLRGEGGYDGAAMTTGKKGGLVRVGGY